MYLHATFILAALSSFVQTTPTTLSGGAIPIRKDTHVRDANGVVDVTTLLRNVRYTTAKFHHGFQAYEQNTGAHYPSGPEVKRSKSSIGNDSLTHYDHFYWYGPMSVGTPPKTFKVDFDTGSTDLILFSSNCGSPCAHRALYNTSESSTAVELMVPFFASFGADPDPAFGMLYQDTVTVAGYTVKQQILGSAFYFPESLNSTNFLPDGILGLGFQSLSSFDATSVLHNLEKQGSLLNNSFGFYLADNGSELYLGGTNDQLHNGDFIYVPLTQVKESWGYWQISFDGLYLGGQKIAGSTGSVVDSGTTLMIGDYKTVQALYKQIHGSADIGDGLFSFPCTFNTSISLQFGGTKIAIHPKTFNMGHVSEKSKSCVGGISAVDDLPFWILGDVFLQNVYTKFDVDNLQIGFATPA